MMQVIVPQGSDVAFVSGKLRRRGSLVVEIIVCTVLLSVVASILVPGIRAISRQRKATRFDTLALIELNNVAAKVRKLDREDVDLTAAFQSRYPDAKLALEDRERDEQLGLPSVKITLSRPAGDALPEVTRSLTIWLAPDAVEEADPVESESDAATEKTAEDSQ